MSIKVAQKLFHLKIKDFNTKNPEKCGQFGEKIVATGSEKLPKVQ